MRKDYDNLIRMIETDSPEFKIEQIHELFLRDTWMLNKKIAFHNVSINDAYMAGKKALAIELLREVRDELYPWTEEQEDHQEADAVSEEHGEEQEDQLEETGLQQEDITIEQLRMEAHTRLTMLRRTIERVSPTDPELQTIDAMLEKMRTHPYKLAVVGEFNRGKSTLINALLGMNILPADVTPTTATINRVVYGEIPGVCLCMQDDSEENIPFTMLKARVTKLSEEAEIAANRVREAVISYPTVFCRNNVSILDTPGLNESRQMDDLTLRHTRNADAVIFLISALVPFSQSEARALIRLLTDSSIRHVLFTVSFIDRLPPEEGVEKRVLSSIRKRVTKTTFPFIDADQELSPEEKERQKAMIEQAPILGVSAQKALDAFVNGSKEDLEKSRIEEYKKELMTRLTAQQDEWLSKDVMPYVKRTLCVFNQAVQRRIDGFASDIQKGQQLTAQAKQWLASMQDDRQAYVEKWANTVRANVGSKAQCKDDMLQVVNVHMKQYPNAGAVNAGTGLKNWAKRQNLYRDEYDPATKQLRAAFEDVKEFGLGMCMQADAIARAEYPATYWQLVALPKRVCETLNEAIKILRAKRSELVPPVADMPDKGIDIFGAEGCDFMACISMPSVTLGSFAAAKQLLGDTAAEKFYIMFDRSLQAICKKQFPFFEQEKAHYDAVVAELEQRIVYLNERLDKLREEAKTMEKLL